MSISDPDTPTKKPMDAIREAALKGQSPAYVWLLKNYPGFKAAIAMADGRFSWSDVADVLAAEGIKNARGAPLNEVTLKKTWARVCHAVARRARSSKVAPKARPPAPGIVRPAEPFQPVIPTKPKYTFELARLRKPGEAID